MPAAIPIAVAAAPALITAAGAVIGGKMNSNASKRAAQMQANSATEAIGYQKSRDAIGDSRYDKKWALYNEAVQDYRRRHGGGGPAIPNLVGAGGGGGVPVSIADLVGAQQGVSDATQGGQGQPGSIAANVGGWNDWQRYGA